MNYSGSQSYYLMDEQCKHCLFGNKSRLKYTIQCRIRYRQRILGSMSNLYLKKSVL